MGENDSLLLSALETFWNNWAYPRRDIILVLCSSVSLWIINHILNDNGILSERLKDLSSCGFIRQYNKLGNKNRDSLYQIIDNFAVFYLKFLKNANYDNNRFSHLMNSNAYNTWKGLAFEQVCLLHVNEIKKALGINGIMNNVCSYNSIKNEEKDLYGTQLIW